ncbi:MAG TPA: gephyrin-like molybdotransferase Glp [Acidimicrobiales bacterium]|nr:gephyrin-like molybdotransferase Glp [Acidimicrobiales bacterium]
MIPLPEAQAEVLARCPVLPAVRVRLDEAAGCVLAEDVTAAEDVPPFANSAVDGYAVRAADTASVPVELPVVGELAAGAPPGPTVGPGEAVRIMTGAPLPDGADAIVMVEDTDRLDGGVRVRIHRTVQAGDAVRGAGDDVRACTVVFAAGTELRPATLGVLASINRREPLVVRRPRVGVVSTGDELVPDDRPLQPGQIRESNKTMLLAVLARMGAEQLDLGLVGDSEPELERVLRDAAERCDAIVSSAGVSMGDYDVVKAVLDRIADMRWMQIAIKPAKPFAFGTLGAGDGRVVPVFGLPGNPVSALVSFELLARPALRKMMGHARVERPRIRAIADDGLPRRPDGKMHLTRVHARPGEDGRFHVASTGPQGSHQLAATAAADAIAFVPDGDGILSGADVDVILID